MSIDGVVAHVAGRLVGVAFLGAVIVAGEVRTFWWLWILYWLMAEVSGAVTDRLTRDSMVLVDSGLRYCTVHHGVVDVDESDCDFRDGLENACPDCEGHGYLVGPEGETHKCGPCDGDAVTRCEATPLLYRGEAGS